MKKKYRLLRSRSGTIKPIRHRLTVGEEEDFNADDTANDLFDGIMNSDEQDLDKLAEEHDLEKDDEDESEDDDDESEDDDESDHEEDESEDDTEEDEDSDDDESEDDESEEESEDSDDDESEDDDDDESEDDDEEESEDDDEDDEEDDEEDPDITHLRSELSIVRKRKKELIKEKKALEKEKQKLVDRAAKAERELQEVQNYQVPLEEHPEYKDKAAALADTTEEAISGLTRLSPAQRVKINANRQIMLSRLATISKESDFTKKTEDYEAFDLTVAKSLGMIDGDIDEFDRSVDSHTIDAMAALRQSLSPAVRDLKDLEGIRSDLQEKIKSGTMETDHRQYIDKSKRTKKLLSAAATISDSIAKKNPNSIHTLTAKRIKDDAQFRAKAEVVDDMLLSIRHGVEPLTQAEIDGMRAAGEDIDKVKTKLAEELRQLEDETLPKLKYALLHYDKFEDFIKEHVEEIAKASSKKSARKASRRGKKIARKTSKKKKKKEKSLEEAQADFNKQFDDLLS